MLLEFASLQEFASKPCLQPSHFEIEACNYFLARHGQNIGGNGPPSISLTVISAEGDLATANLIASGLTVEYLPYFGKLLFVLFLALMTSNIYLLDS